MTDLTLKVKTKKQFVFNPDELMVRTLPGANLATGNTGVYYELKETTLDNSRYISREWIDKGNVEAPLNLLSNTIDHESGAYNIPLINQFLATFNLEIDTEAMNLDENGLVRPDPVNPIN